MINNHYLKEIEEILLNTLGEKYEVSIEVINNSKKVSEQSLFQDLETKTSIETKKEQITKQQNDSGLYDNCQDQGRNLNGHQFAF